MGWGAVPRERTEQGPHLEVPGWKVTQVGLRLRRQTCRRVLHDGWLRAVGVPLYRGPEPPFPFDGVGPAVVGGLRSLPGQQELRR